MNTNIKLKISGYKGIKTAFTIELGKVILYGPNGAGKSSLIELVAALFVSDIFLTEYYGYDITADSQKIYDNFLLEITHNNISAKIKRENSKFLLSINSDTTRLQESFDTAKDAINELSDKLNLRKNVTLIGPCKFVSSYREIFIADACNGQLDLSNLYIADLQKYEKELYTALNIGGVKYARSKRYDLDAEYYVQFDGEWIPFKDLAYGLRRAMLIILATIISDVILIESFEASLHSDLAIALIRYLSGVVNKFVVLESHHGAALADAVASGGWTSYYLEGGTRLVSLKSIDDLRNTELFHRELEIYTT